MLQMYSRLVDKCFNDCIDDFTSKSVSAREEGCIMRCWDKNMKSQERIQQRCGTHGIMHTPILNDPQVPGAQRSNDGLWIPFTTMNDE
jgi:hypothetical protein